MAHLNWLKILRVIGFVTFFLILAPASIRSASAASPKTFTAVVGLQSRNFATQGMVFAPHDLYINKGDNVDWKVETNDLHTVTLLKSGQTLPDFNPSDPQQTQQQGTGVYDGVSYYNSGLMSLDPNVFPPFTIATTYTLKFDVVGNFTYYSLVHPGMHAVVHVRPAGTPYPFTQHTINKQVLNIKLAVIDEGLELTTRGKLHSNNHNVTLGIGGTTEAGDMVSVVRFFPSNIHIEKSESIKFTNHDMMPHTVSYGVITDPFSNTGDPSHFDGNVFNHLVLPGDSFTFIPVKAGTYHLYCAFHDTLNMVATLSVEE